jgi:hypothetical protein
MALSGSTLTQLDELLATDPNVVGFARHEIETGAGETGLRLYLAEDRKSPVDEIDGLPVEAVVTGWPEPKASAAVGVGVEPTTKVRPLVGGISISGAGSGTLGYFVKRKSDGKLCLMSAAHVLKAGTDDVIQQSFRDGGSLPDDLVAKLDASVLVPGQGIDAASAVLVDQKGATLELNYIGHVSGTGTIAKDDVVKKSGKMTKETAGTIDAVNTSVTAKDGTRYDDMMCIAAGPKKPFSEGGDSGSLIVTVDPEIKAVGLLWGGTTTHDWACHIGPVLHELGTTLAT